VEFRRDHLEAVLTGQSIHTPSCKDRSYSIDQVGIHMAQRDGSVHPFSNGVRDTNEAVNIHTHFIPTLLIMLAIPVRPVIAYRGSQNPLMLQVVLWASPLTDPHPLDTYIIALYLLAAVACLSSSASWHVLSGCASKKWFEWGACVDCEWEPPSIRESS
jgi:predicted membrane channel-forming protein YqfA (hemolysin III family)